MLAHKAKVRRLVTLLRGHADAYLFHAATAEQALEDASGASSLAVVQGEQVRRDQRSSAMAVATTSSEEARNAYQNVLAAANQLLITQSKAPKPPPDLPSGAPSPATKKVLSAGA